MERRRSDTQLNLPHPIIKQTAAGNMCDIVRVCFFPDIRCWFAAATVADRRQTDFEFSSFSMEVVFQYPPSRLDYLPAPQSTDIKTSCAPGRYSRGREALQLHVVETGRQGPARETEAPASSASSVLPLPLRLNGRPRNVHKATERGGDVGEGIGELGLGNQKNQGVPTGTVDPRGRGKRKTLAKRVPFPGATEGSSFDFGKQLLVNHRNTYKDCRLVSDSKTPAGRVLSFAEETSRLSRSGVSAKRSSGRPSMLLKCIDL